MKASARRAISAFLSCISDTINTSPTVWPEIWEQIVIIHASMHVHEKDKSEVSVELRVHIPQSVQELLG
jgi:hypothetical protein